MTIEFLVVRMTYPTMSELEKALNDARRQKIHRQGMNSENFNINFGSKSNTRRQYKKTEVKTGKGDSDDDGSSSGSGKIHFHVNFSSKCYLIMKFSSG